MRAGAASSPLVMWPKMMKCHGSASEEDDDPTIEEKAVGKVVGTWNPVGASDVIPLGRHFVSRCIHVVEDESGTSTKCGRMISTRYVRLIERPRFMHPVCSTCFKRRPKIMKK